jgi:DNA-binding transcriptional ArsR family regulator
MADLLPSDPDLDAPEAEEARVLGVDSDDADAVLDALSSATARELLAALHEEPAPPSRLADRVDTTLQNAQYHLEKLREADLVEARGTQYSAKGREMTVYGPADAPLVLFAGSESKSQGIKGALANLLGALGVLAAASLLVQFLAGGVDLPAFGGAGGADSGDGGGASGGDGASGGTDGGNTQDAAVETTTEAAATGGDAVAGAEAALGLPPGALFFLGGLAALAIVVGIWYVRRR